MYERILIPTDGSTGTTHVAMQAIDLAKQYYGELYVLSVVETGGLLPGSDETAEDLQRESERAVRQVEAMASTHGVSVETAIREGDPSDEILAYADEIDADAIVAGTHGRTGVQRQLIGSVAERLVRHSPIPVMTVPLPATDETVETEEAARRVAADAIEAQDYHAEVTDVEEQRGLWVVHAETSGGVLVVYIDPVTQRTQVLEQD